ncbi:MAG: SIS domain-containing protein [Zetaproteobacteria bacterium]|nr:SIS domain-containing protein [Zetaproteobacteria bacterium]
MEIVVKDLSVSGLIERYPKLEGAQPAILEAINALLFCFSNQGKLLVAGNGGSSADAEHFCGELLKGFKSKRPLSTADARMFEAIDPDLPLKLQGSLPAISLGVGHSAISAVANDMDASLIFAQQIWGLGNKQDMFFGMSTSGNSKNVVTGFKVAKAKKMKTVALTGVKESSCSQLADITIHAPESETFKIQEYHLPIYHAICIEVENYIFGG